MRAFFLKFDLNCMHGKACDSCVRGVCHPGLFAMRRCRCGRIFFMTHFSHRIFSRRVFQYSFFMTGYADYFMRGLFQRIANGRPIQVPETAGIKPE
jgi:hypothetical protein